MIRCPATAGQTVRLMSCSAGLVAEGWSYGVASSVTWIDLMGAVHDRGWPSCFGAVGEVPRVRFGAVSVALPDNGSQRIVVYVDCRR